MKIQWGKKRHDPIISIKRSFYNAESSMIPVLRKVAQLNIKYRKNGGLILDVCTGPPPDKVTALDLAINMVDAFRNPCNNNAFLISSYSATKM